MSEKQKKEKKKFRWKTANWDLVTIWAAFFNLGIFLHKWSGRTVSWQRWQKFREQKLSNWHVPLIWRIWMTDSCGAMLPGPRTYTDLVAALRFFQVVLPARFQGDRRDLDHHRRAGESKVCCKPSAHKPKVMGSKLRATWGLYNKTLQSHNYSCISVSRGFEA